MPDTVSLLSEVLAFLGDSPLGLFIDGRLLQSKSGRVLSTRNPATDSPIADFADGDAEDVDRAVASAAAAFERSAWSGLAPANRAIVLHRLADLIEERIHVIAQLESLDVGKPLNQPTSFDVPHVAKTFRYYADLAIQISYRELIGAPGVEAYTFRSPYGVCGFVLPWNFPFLLLGWNIAPALAAGNTVVIKPSEETPLSTLYFAMLAKEAGVPDGVVNVVTGTGAKAGAYLASHPGLARVAFTGSPEVGRLVAVAAAKNLIPCKLELGGKGAAIVFDDVDAEAVAQELANAITLNSGQVCCTATRWLVHENIYDRFVSSTSTMLAKLRIGDPLNPETQMGPVVSDKQRQRILTYLDKGDSEGASTILKSQVLAGNQGYFVTPALLAGAAENICAREEIFGPAAYILKFSTDNEAISLVNGSRYGLANSVWSSDIPRARRISEALVAGNCWINTHNLFVHGLPYGGTNLSGLGGGVLGPDAITDYLRSQSIARLL
jgi:aldehyde dehydrogenase (NAD+)